MFFSVFYAKNGGFFVQSAPRQVFLRVRKSHRGTTADEKKKRIFYGGITSIVNCNFVPEMNIS